ncbi:MAG: T9SS type A sorting domain-containing protein [Bacteroidales bacterium]|nr:T9SS type A sorting domain-containing protein [Bacteroidales bacterium]
MKKILYSLLLLSIAFTGVSQTPLLNAVQIDAKDFNGSSHNLFNYLNSGKHVLLSFSTMNCGSCSTYNPHVSIIYEQYGCNNGDLIVIGVNWGATNMQLLEYHQQNGYNFPSISGIEGYGNEINEAYQIQSFISVILIAPDHTIVEQYIYPPSVSELESLLSSYGLNATACTVGYDNIADSEKKGFIAFPNPAIDFFSISLGSDETEFNVSLYDLNGRLIRSYKNQSSQSTSLSLLGVDDGVYVIKAWNEDSFYSSRLLVLR